MKKGVFENFVKIKGKHLCQSLFFHKVAGPGLLLYYGTIIKIFVFEVVQIRVNIQLMQRLTWKNLGKFNKSEFFFLCCIFWWRDAAHNWIMPNQLFAGALKKASLIKYRMKSQWQSSLKNRFQCRHLIENYLQFILHLLFRKFLIGYYCLCFFKSLLFF